MNSLQESLVFRESSIRRVALCIDREFLPSNLTEPESFETLEEAFHKIKVDVFFPGSEFQQRQLETFKPKNYDLVAFVGRVRNISSTRESEGHANRFSGNLLRRRPSIVPNSFRPLLVRLAPCREMSSPSASLGERFVDTTIFYQLDSKKREEHFSFAYRVFQSLTLPSTLNIDFADLSRIARGKGYAFHLEGDKPKDIISQLPSYSFTATRGLNHFSCAEDVSLDEVYEVSETIALNRGRMERIRSRIFGRSDLPMRNANLKTGIRISEHPKDSPGVANDESPHFGRLGESENPEQRIVMTSLLFDL